MNKIFLLIAFLFSSTFSISSFTYPWIINLTGDTATVVKWKSNNDTVKAFCDIAADTITNNSARLDTLEDTIAVHSLKIDSLQDTSSLQSARIDTLEDTVAVHSTHLDAVDDSLAIKAPKAHGVSTSYYPYANSTTTLNERYVLDTLSGTGIKNNLFILNGASGGAATDAADRLSLISSSSEYINFSTPNTAIAGFLFSDDVRATGLITYDHSLGRVRFKVEGDEAFYIHPDSAVATSRITSPIIGDTVVDYAATSTVTGWSSFTTKVIRYQKSGKVIHVWFEIRGTSNATSASFTLPHIPASGVYMDFNFTAADNGGSAVVSAGFMDASVGAGDLVNLQPTTTTISWTASGTKFAYGQFTYFID